MENPSLHDASYVEKMNSWDFSVYEDVIVGERTSRLRKYKPKYRAKKCKVNVSPDEFWKYVEVKEEDDCWEWIGYRSEFGHGRICVTGTYTAAHRIAYTLSKGEIPEGLLIRHECDNPPCCNPKHLIVGTHHDNAQDRVRRRRFNCIHSRKPY